MTQDTLTTTPEASAGAPLSEAQEAAATELDLAATGTEGTTTDATESTEGTEQAEQGEGEETPEFGVELSYPNRDQEGPAEKFNLAVPDQKTADALRYHFNRSQSFGKLEKDYATAQQSVRALDTLEQDPIIGMHLLAEDPKVGEAFAASWLRENYLTAATLLKEMGLSVELGPKTTQRELDLEADVARGKREQRLREAQQRSQGNVVQEQFTGRARALTMDLAATIPFGDQEDREMFEAMAGKTLGSLYHKNPHASPAEMTTALHGLVSKFAGRATKTITAKAQSRDEAGKFQRAKVMAGKMAKIGSGTTGLASVSGQFDPTDDLLSFTERLEGKR